MDRLDRAMTETREVGEDGTSERSPVERGARHRCQRLKNYKNRCRSGKKTQPYTIMADREAYIMINVRVYLCPKCAEEMGV